MLPFMISRRSVLSSCVTAGIAALLPRNGQSGTPAVREYALVAAPSSASIVGTAVPQQTRVWAYRGSVPGPELRVRQGDRLRVRVENLLPEETTVHWHGVRVPNAMDGVPHLTQPPIAPGSTSSTNSIVLMRAAIGIIRIRAALNKSSAALLER